MKSRLQGIFEDFENLNVLVIGDVMLDSYIFGTVKRISPEAPVPIVSIKQKEDRLGGAANVARNVHAMGATPILCSVVGNDYEGGKFIELLHNEDISDQGIVKSSERRTTVKQRVLGGSQQLLRIDNEDTNALSAKDKSQLLERINSLIPQIDVVIFEDYDKGVIDDEIIGFVTQWANSHRVSVVVDPKKNNFSQYKNATLFKPNLKEVNEGLSLELDGLDEAELKKCAGRLMHEMSLEGVMVTLSDKGVYIAYNREFHLVPAHVRDVADVSGAGDTVVSIAALCLAMGLSPRQIAEISNLAGGLVCEHAGVVPIDKKQLMEETEKYNIIQ